MAIDAKLETSGTATTTSLSSADSPSPSPAPKISKHRERWQKVYGTLGFNRGYNFPLFIIFGGAMFGFSISRMQFWNFDNIFSVQVEPGEWFYYRQGRDRYGMIIHLAGSLSAGALVVLQFVPAIRHRALLFHRLNGYVVILLMLLGTAGGLSITNYLLRPSVAEQTVLVAMAFSSVTALSIAYYNIKRLQVDQHRAWMLRAWFYQAAIITSRIFVHIGAPIVASMGGSWGVWPCDKLEYTFKQFGLNGTFERKYPQCLNGADRVVVTAGWSLESPEEMGVAINNPFGGALWMALFLHAIGIEIYLQLTPRESNRLRQVSYQKQLEAGYKNPGYAGLTVQRWGDAEEWKPQMD